MNNLTGSTTLAACNRLGSGLTSVASALFALYLGWDLDLFLCSKARFFKGDAYLGAQIGSLGWGVGIRRTSGSAEASAEEVAENIPEASEDIIHIHIEPATAGASIEGCMTELVILTALIRITEDSIGFGGLLELGLRFLVPGVGIRVVFLGEYTIRFLQRRVIGVFVDAEDFVVISLI